MLVGFSCQQKSSQTEEDGKVQQKDQAEAVDQLGVWAKCRVLESQQDFAVVTFLPWPQKWNKTIFH